jgi:hypothetical protein
MSSDESSKDPAELLEPGPLAEYGRPCCHLHGAKLDEAPARVLFEALRRSLDAVRTITYVACGGVPGLTQGNHRWLAEIVARRLNDFDRYLAIPKRSTLEMMHAAGFHDAMVTGDSFLAASYTEVAVRLVMLWRKRLLGAIPGKTAIAADDIVSLESFNELILSIRPQEDMEVIACGLWKEWMAAVTNGTREKNKRPRADKPRYFCDPSVSREIQQMVELMNPPHCLAQGKAAERAAADSPLKAASIARAFRRLRDDKKRNLIRRL